MSESEHNIYNYIVFPDAEKRESIRNNYLVDSDLRKISLCEIVQGIEALDYETVLRTRIEEYNYTIFTISIPLFQMLNTYEDLQSDKTQNEDKPYHYVIFSYYIELLAYFIISAFEKSCNIYNVLFQLKIDVNKQGSKQEILKAMKKKTKENRLIEKIYKELNKINKTDCYKKINRVRNETTHNYRISRAGYFEKYNLETGVKSVSFKKPIEVDEIVKIIIESINLLNRYTVFIEVIVEEHYESLN